MTDNAAVNATLIQCNNALKGRSGAIQMKRNISLTWNLIRPTIMWWLKITQLF